MENRHVIYYFTGTGNSLSLAKSLANKTDCGSIVPIAKAINEKLPSSINTLGIVCPNYAFNIPHIVRRFIKKVINETTVNYCYIVINAAGNNGNAVDKVKKLVKKFPGKAVFTLLMPYNYMVFGDVFDAAKEQERLEAAKKGIEEIAGKVRSRETYFSPKINYLKVAIMPGLLYAMAYPGIPKMDKNFWVNESCNGCGICQKVCPVQNITMLGEKPQWQEQGRCEQCFACINWCPKQSIQYKNATEDKGRYHHPGVKVTDMFLFDK